jgi:ABC-2 type transport system ATP-binding protein
VVLSTHLIDEVADLLERVILIDHGRLVLDQDAESLRRDAVSLTGPADAVRAATDGLVVLHRQHLGGVSRVVVRTGGRDLRAIAEPPVRAEPVSLQQLMVHLSGLPAPEGATPGPEAGPDTGPDVRPDATEARVPSTNGHSR